MLLIPLALADTLDPRAIHPWAVRGELEFVASVAELSGPKDVLPEVTVSWAASRRWAIDATLGYGIGPDRTGFNSQLLLRYVAARDSARSAGATFAAGPRVATGGPFGTVASIAAEGGVDFRAASGFCLAAGLGPLVFPNDSPEVDKSCGWFCSGENRFQAGGLGFHARMGAG